MKIGKIQKGSDFLYFVRNAFSHKNLQSEHEHVSGGGFRSKQKLQFADFFLGKAGLPSD